MLVCSTRALLSHQIDRPPRHSRMPTSRDSNVCLAISGPQRLVEKSRLVYALSYSSFLLLSMHPLTLPSSFIQEIY